MRLRRAQNHRFSLYPLPHALATHYFLRLTRARGRCFLRGRKALLNDFWYFSSRKSTPFLLKKKLSRATAVARFLFFAKRKKQECQNIPAFFHYYFAVTMSPFSSAARQNSVPGAGLSAISFLAIIVSASDWINLFIGRAP